MAPLIAGIAKAALIALLVADPGYTILSMKDGQVEIAYWGGKYVGQVEVTAGAAPVWQGRCTFYFRTGHVFDGNCRQGDFDRGFLRSPDGKTTRFFDGSRSLADTIKSLQETTGL